MTHHIAITNMITQQLRTGNVLDEHILSLYEEIPRHQFVPQGFSEFAYTDMQIPLGHGQRMMTPLEEGQILQNLQLKGHEVVLEVGTGSGFFTALLSRLCKKVISLDYYEDFTASAAVKLKLQGCKNIQLITGDAYQGWLELAPFDVAIFTGAVEEISDTHKLQILPGGKLFAIVGKAPAMQGQLLSVDHEGNWSKNIIFETRLPPLIDKLKPKEFIF